MTKPADYSEVDAMRDIDSALAKIAAEEQQRVLDWASSKYLTNKPHEFRAPTQEVVEKNATSAETPNIKDFVADKNPGNFYERTACLAYHLEKFQGKPDVDNKDVVE